ncbi:MAG TPA: cell division protein ZapA [Longimicrobiales bacterium]|nr:cell division protein ZapA [Longimicrobiales bacterium]
MKKAPERTVVTVEIAGEEYNIRALASPEYTKDCAAYVDRTLSEIMRQGSLLQAHKGAILAALALADELFQTRAQLDALRTEVSTRAGALASAIEDRLEPSGLAGDS